MSILAGIILGGFLFGGNKCQCKACVSSRKKEHKEYLKYLKKTRGRSTSLLSSVSTSTSV